MAKSWILELDGEVVEVLPAGKFRVKLKDMEVIIMCYKAWKMKQSHISVIEWDWVKVEVNQYDFPCFPPHNTVPSLHLHHEPVQL